MSVRGIWTDEANMEAEDIMQRKMSALLITGGNSKVVAKEVFNSFYELTKDGNTPAVNVSAADTKAYLDMKPDDITRTFLCDTFADTVNITNGNKAGKRKSHYNTWDKMKIPANYFYEGQEEMTMTIGRFIANKFVFESGGYIKAIGINNCVWDKKRVSTIDDQVGHLYMEDIINRDQYDSYLDHRDTLGYWLNGMLAHTISPKMVKPLPEIEKKKAELIKKYEKELAEHDIDVMTKISDELVAYAKEVLKDDPGMDLYVSGDLDFNNNYKNNSIIKGSVFNQLSGEFDFIETSFMDGAAIKDIPAHANSILASQFPASIATSKAGYMGKQLIALLQMMSVDYNNLDCGTKNTIPLTVTNYNKKFLDQTVFIERGTEKTLSTSNIDSYVGKTIQMRSPMSCVGEKLCAKCASNLFKMLDAENVGLYVSQISHAALNLGLKAKHNSVVELHTLDVDSIICDIE